MREKLIKSKTLHQTLTNKAKDIVCDIHISIPLDLDKDNKVKCLGVWDTGSHSCLLSPALVKKLNPPLIGYKLLSGVVKDGWANEYMINIHLSDEFSIEGIGACEGENLEDNEFLIGMDIINMGDFAITNVSKKTAFSFKKPSIQRINFQSEKDKAIKESNQIKKKQKKETFKIRKKRKGKKRKFRK